MNHTSISNFLNNAEDIINNTVTNNEVTAIKTEDGSDVLMSGKQYNYLVGQLRDKHTLSNDMKEE